MKNELEILLVEDNEGDIVLFLEAMETVNVSNKIRVVRDGEEALQYLRKQGIYENVETPGLILLDINLPKIDGIEVLIEIKKEDPLKIIPVVMLTTSDSKKDIFDCYYNQANCYITKPSEYKQFSEVIQSICEFWTLTAELPKI